MILASAPGAHFDELGTKTDFRQRSITFLIRILLGKLRQIFGKFGGSLRRRKEEYGTIKKINENIKENNENI